MECFTLQIQEGTSWGLFSQYLCSIDRTAQLGPRRRVQIQNI
jgi:hypothetical protein